MGSSIDGLPSLKVRVAVFFIVCCVRSQTLNQGSKRGFVIYRVALQPVKYFHIRQDKQPLKGGDLFSPKCSAVRLPKATQPEIEFQQAAPTTPGNGIRHAA